MMLFDCLTLRKDNLIVASLWERRLAIERFHAEGNSTLLLSAATDPDQAAKWLAEAAAHSMCDRQAARPALSGQQARHAQVNQ